jgi:hypothetical protein
LWFRRNAPRSSSFLRYRRVRPSIPALTRSDLRRRVHPRAASSLLVRKRNSLQFASSW